MVTIQQIERALQELGATDMSTSLFFLLRERGGEGTEYSVLRTRLPHEIAVGFKEILMEALRKICRQPDLEFTEYDPLFIPPGNTFETIQIDMIPHCGGIISNMDLPCQLDYPGEIDKDFLERLWAYAVKVSNGERSYYYFRKYWKRNVLQTGGKLKLFFDRGTFSRVESDVFSFDGKMDSLVLGSNMIILQKNLFEQIFEYLEEHKRIAGHVLATLEQTNLIYGFEELVQACESDFRKMRKLAGISNTIDVASLTFEDLRDVAHDFQLDLKFHEDIKKIEIQGRQKVWNFLKLIGDDLLKSPLTKNKYEVQSKRRYA